HYHLRTVRLMADILAAPDANLIHRSLLSSRGLDRSLPAMKPDNDAEPIPAGEQDQAGDQQAVPVCPRRHESANASISLPLAVARGFVTPSQSAPDLRSPAHLGPLSSRDECSTVCSRCHPMTLYFRKSPQRAATSQ